MRASASDTSIALSDAGALVHHVGRDRGQPFLLGRVGAGPAFDLQDDRDDRHGVVLDRADVESVRERVADDLGKLKRRDRRQRPAAASDRQPSGHRHRLGAGERERLLAARNDAQNHAARRSEARRAAAARTCRVCGVAIAREVAREERRDRRRTRCRRSADRTCRRSRRPSAGGRGNAPRPAPRPAPSRPADGPSSTSTCSSASMAAAISVSDCPGAAVAATRKKLPSSRELWYADTSRAMRRS